MTLDQAIDNLMRREYGMADVIRDLSTETYNHVFSLLDNELSTDDAGRIATLVERTLADALRVHFGDTA